MFYLNLRRRPSNSAEFTDLSTVSPASSPLQAWLAARLPHCVAGAFAAALLLNWHAAHAAGPKPHAHSTAAEPTGPVSADLPEEVAFAPGAIAASAWQLSGTASYYGPRHTGHRAADGSTFNQEELTAAHPWLPFGTRVLVTALETGRQVIVTITDRMPQRKRLIDLSLAAARELGMLHSGIMRVTLLPA